MTFDEWESKTIALAGESPNAYARRAFTAALKLSAGAGEGQAEPVAWISEQQMNILAHNAFAAVSPPGMREPEDVIPLYRHPSAELIALRERVKQEMQAYAVCASARDSLVEELTALRERIEYDQATLTLYEKSTAALDAEITALREQSADWERLYNDMAKRFSEAINHEIAALRERIAQLEVQLKEAPCL